MKKASKKNMTPMQPYLRLYAQNYQRILSGEADISHFYEFTMETGKQEALQAVPDGSVDLLFSIGERDVHTYIGGTVLKVKNWPMEADRLYFGVRFQPGRCKLPKDLSIQDVVNNDLEIQGDCYGNDLLSRLWEEPDLDGRARVFTESYQNTMKALNSLEAGQPLEKYICNRIYETKGNISIRDLSEEMGYSECYIRRSFGKVHGISPKLFEKFVRFQSAIERMDMLLSKKGRISFDELALACGYYDQSHMIKEFKTFCGVTPEAYTKMMKGGV